MYFYKIGTSVLQKVLVNYIDVLFIGIYSLSYQILGRAIHCFINMLVSGELTLDPLLLEWRCCSGLWLVRIGTRSCMTVWFNHPTAPLPITIGSQTVETSLLLLCIFVLFMWSSHILFLIYSLVSAIVLQIITYILGEVFCTSTRLG